MTASKKAHTESHFSKTKLAAYLAAGSAALVAAENADADITIVGVGALLEDTIAGDGLGQGLQLAFGDAASFNVDLFHTVGSTVAATGYGLVGGDLFGGGVPGAEIAGFLNGAYFYASNLAAGADLSALTNWIAPTDVATMAFNSGYGNSQFLTPGEGFLGVRYDNGGGFSYGWVRVTMNGNPLNSFTVVDYGFGDAGEAISVAQVPEPSSLAVMALGASGALIRRRRKAA